MQLRVRLIFTFVAALVFTAEAVGQQEEICSDRGIISLIDTPTKRFSVVFGRISIKQPKGSLAPTVVVWLREGRATQRLDLVGNGSYCFERSNAGGEVTVDINGMQADRRTIITTLSEQREDFEFSLTPTEKSVPPGVVSAKFIYQRKNKNAKLFDKAVRAIAEKDHEKAIEILAAVFKEDPNDYVAAATLAAVHYREKNYAEAERWFGQAVKINQDYVPAWLSLAQSQYGQSKFTEAIESCKQLIKLEPTSALAFYILGEAYLRTGKGNLAVEALKGAIKLDPAGMAECHLIIADLYDSNGLKTLAVAEYKAFIAKVPEHPEKKKIEKYILDNPD